MKLAKRWVSPSCATVLARILSIVPRDLLREAASFVTRDPCLFRFIPYECEEGQDMMLVDFPLEEFLPKIMRYAGVWISHDILDSHPNCRG